MRTDGTFIGIEVADGIVADPAVAAKLAEWVTESSSRLPIVAFMAGRFMDDEEMQGMSFGHAGTIVEGREDTATEKIARLEAAGIPVVERIDEIPGAVKEQLGVAV